MFVSMGLILAHAHTTGINTNQRGRDRKNKYFMLNIFFGSSRNLNLKVFVSSVDLGKLKSSALVNFPLFGR